MSEPSNKGVVKRNLFHAMYVGYGMLLACCPTTSATEVAVTAEFLAVGRIGWLDQVSFVLCFTVGIVLINAFPKTLPSVFARKGLLPASIASVVVGIGLYVMASSGAADPDWMLVGSALRGLGCAGLTVGWLELMVDMAPRIRHTSIVLPLSLFAAAVLGMGIWLVALVAGSVAVSLILGVLPLVSYGLLSRSKSALGDLGIRHLYNERELDMPKATRLIIFVFGVALGCTWTVFYSILGVDLPMWACLAFLALSIFVMVGMRTFFPRRELEFGFALRWSMLFTVAGFLLVPIVIERIPVLAAFFLALAWAVQILLLALMPVKMASKLPFNVVSVASQGGAAYGIGATLSSIASGAVFAVWGADTYAYSIVTALVCFCFAVASLYFPGRNADASMLGLENLPETELYAQRIQRRSAEVAQKWGLTARESEITYLLALGKTRSQIASQLSISEETVKTHSKHIYEKLDVHSLRELVSLVEDGTL